MSMFNKEALDSNMIVAFLKDANVVGADVDPDANTVTLHVDEDSPDVSFDLSTMLSKYVLKQQGKELSSNDFTDELKDRLLEIQDQVQSDWDEQDTNDVSYIKNKPDLYLPTNDTRSVLDDLSDDGNGNLLYKNKPADSVQPDWNETNPDHKTYIQNKPDLYLPTHETRDVLDELTEDEDGNLLYKNQPVDSVQPDWLETNPDHKTYIQNKPDLSGIEHDNREVLDALSVDANGYLNYDGLPVNTEYQSDWNETDHTKPWFIRNKKDYYLPQSDSNRQALHSLDVDVDDRLTYKGDKVALEKELLDSVRAVNMYGSVSSISLGV